MKIHRLKKGYSIPIKGEAEKIIRNAGTPSSAGVSPLDFRGITPRLNVKVNDTVRIGSILFHDKKNPEIKFSSPVSGKIREIVYGQRRVIEKISITPSGDDCEQFPNYRLKEIPSLRREQLIDHLLSGGMWPLIRQRPFNKIANPHDTPSSIFVNCMDTSPLACDPEFSLKDTLPEFRAGVEALKILSQKVHVVIRGNNPDSDFLKVEGVEKHSFTGKHPAGLVGTHMARIDPVTLHKKVWYLNAGDVIKLGSFLLVGQYPSEQIIAVSGSGLKKTGYLKITTGSVISDLLRDNLVNGEMRIISGNVLTGQTKSLNDFIGFYDNLITVIPEGRERKFLGWMLPGFNRYTYSRAFASSLLPGRKFNMNTGQNGEPRAFVKTGDYEKVMGVDVFPDFIVKAVLSEDVEMMEQLGILECAGEDVALCSYICPSKIEFTEIIERGLRIIEKEME